MKKSELVKWAKEEGIPGYSQMSKAEMQDLWEESQPTLPRKIYYSLHKQPPPPDPVEKFEAPILKPEKIKIPKQKIPEVIEEQIETIEDWLNWLEEVDEQEIREQISELWENKLVVEEGISALKGFAKEFVIKGDKSISPQHFYKKAKPFVVNLLNSNSKTKVKLILHVELTKYDFRTEEEVESNPFFHSRFSPNSQEGNKEEKFDGMAEETIVDFKNFNKNGSNWRFKSVVSLTIKFVK